MLRLDRRQGSGELERFFFTYGIKPDVCTLDFGDMAWTGSGPGGSTVAVVVERKRIDGRSSDLIDSIQKHRLSGYQLGGMQDAYDYGYLLVEGIYRADKEGALEIYCNGEWQTKGLAWTAIDGYLDSAWLRGGLMTIRSANERETARVVANRYLRWQESWESHRSHDMIYAPSGPEETNGIGLSGGLSGGLLRTARRDVSLCEKIAYQIPGLDRKSRYAAEHFDHCPRKMVNAGAEEWAKAVWRDVKGKGKKIGKDLAIRIEEMLAGKRR